MKPQPGISWFVEDWGVSVIHANGSGRCSIRYPHAALWTLISNGNYTEEYATELIAILSEGSGLQAAAFVAETLTAWQAQGLISME